MSVSISRSSPVWGGALMNKCCDRARAVVAFMIVVTASACSREAPSPVTMRDSAGVRIVANSAADSAWGGERPWRTSLDLTIGSDSSDDYRFGQIGDVAVTSTGEILVLDQSAAQIKVFGSDGRFKRVFGREGRGPGEFSRFANQVLVAPNDSLYIPDPRDRRMSVFAADGKFGRIITMPTIPLGKSWQFLENGTFLERGYTTSRNPDGSFAFWDAMLRVDADGRAADTLFVFDHTKTNLGGPGKIRIALIVNNPSWARLADGRFVWSALDRDWLAVHDSTGHLVGRWSRAQWATRPVSPGDKEALRELLRVKVRALGGSPSIADSPMVEAPERFPAITAVRAGPEGTIWVQRMGEVDAIDPMALNASERSDFFGGSRWDVLDDEGRYLGTLPLLDRLRVFRIIGDAIYGAQRDEEGVEHVVRLRLRRDA